eukprot:SAG31_NODE_1416_length_8441_cov_11.436706_4_plen_391_part_00
MRPEFVSSVVQRCHICLGRRNNKHAWQPRPRGSPRLASRHVSPHGLLFAPLPGVLLRGKAPVPGATQALAKLREARIPHVFVTNGGGRSECRKAAQMCELLGGPDVATAEQVCLAHTPMRGLAAKYWDRNVLILGCIDYAAVAADYGFNPARTFTVPELMAAKPELLPFFDADAAYNRQVATADTSKAALEAAARPRVLDCGWPEGGFAAVVQLTDAVDWTAELQITLDVLRGGDPLGSGASQAIPLYSSNADFVFQGRHAAPRLAGAAFLECLDALLKRSTGAALEVQWYGKPYSSTYRHAEQMLRAEARRLGTATVERFWGVGDNPAADIRGANNAGDHWRSALVRTGVFGAGGEENSSTDPADVVVDDISSFVDCIVAGGGGISADN